VRKDGTALEKSRQCRLFAMEDDPNSIIYDPWQKMLKKPLRGIGYGDIITSRTIKCGHRG
jgi:hypothetical protein